MTGVRTLAVHRLPKNLWGRWCERELADAVDTARVILHTSDKVLTKSYLKACKRLSFAAM